MLIVLPAGYPCLAGCLLHPLVAFHNPDRPAHPFPPGKGRSQAERGDASPPALTS